MTNNIDIFSSAKPQGGEFFKFQNVGDSIQGTYIDVRVGTDSFGNQQTIYVLQDSTGKVWNLGFRQSSMIIHERMAGIHFGQIVGFRFDEHRESKKNPGTKAKIIRIYADSKMLDHEWLKAQRELEATFGGSPVQAVNPVQSTGQQQKNEDTYGFDGEEEETENQDIPFNSPATGGSSPVEEAKPRNEAVDAIRNLAKTKGLTTEAMSEAEADEVIEKYTGHTLVEENLTKVIIALTGYVSK
jgi:hypothetical protein